MSGRPCHRGRLQDPPSPVCSSQKAEGLMQLWLHLKQNRPELYLAPDTSLCLASKNSLLPE